MARARTTPLERQVRRVRRRLFVRTLAVHLLWSWAAAFVLSAIWFVAQAQWLGAAHAWRLGAPSIIMAIATAAVVFASILWAPSRIEAALLVDDKFQLKERITTALTLAPEDGLKPAATALLADANQCIGKLKIGSRIPLGVPLVNYVAAGLAAVLAGAAFLYHPSPTQATDQPADPKAEVISHPADLEQKINQLRKKPDAKSRDRARSEELKRIDAELEQIANRPRGTKEQLKERIREMSSLEDRLRAREKDIAEKSQGLHRQLRQMDKLGSEQAAQDGPAREFQKALAQGKFDQARQELEKLSKKLQSNELTTKEKEELARQLKELQDKIERLARQKDKADELRRLQAEGKLSSETYKREMQQLQEEAKKLQSLQQLAQQLGECQKCLAQGKAAKAGDEMASAAARLKSMELDDNELNDLREQLSRLEEAKDACCRGESDQISNSPGSDDPAQASGRRPESNPMSTKSFETKLKGKFDKGKLVFEGYAPGPHFKKKSTAEMAGEVRQAAQEAPEALEQQRIPKSAREMAKEYFRNLAGGEPPPSKGPRP